jgi:hypothetical protein
MTARSARSKLEAVTRLSGLTHRPPESLGPGSKERKSVLLNLATDLGIPVDTRLPKPAVGEQLATALGATWDARCWSSGSTITLEGLNRILQQAERRVTAQQRAPQLELFAPTPADIQFSAARSKLEAVSRISAVTDAPPETLGPGSKERKSALVNLALGLDLQVDTTVSKPELGRAIAVAIGATWDSSCWSAGHTITLEGLNRLLEAAEAWQHRLGRVAHGLFLSVQDEARALLEALRDALPMHWDGKTCVREMHEAAYSQWAQDEWAAFYFEYLGLPALINTFGGGPLQFANTRIDYSLGHPWDLKVHMADSRVAPLNDQKAVLEGLRAGSGVGFLVLTGTVQYDAGDFRQWQRRFRSDHGKKAQTRTTPAAYVRKSKVAFRPDLLEAFFIPDEATLEAAVAGGSIRVMKQGRQTSGAPRPPKYAIDLIKARWSGELLLAQAPL